MLVLKRKEGQWTKVTDKQGNVLNIRFMGMSVDAKSGRPCFDMVFDDAAHNFEIERPERKIIAGKPVVSVVEPSVVAIKPANGF